MLPRKFSDNMMRSGAIRDVPKDVISTLKMNNFKGKKSTIKLKYHMYCSQTNPDEHVSMKIKTLRIQGGSGG